MTEGERLCECGHRKRWHSHGGAGGCEADARHCACRAFREYMPPELAAQAWAEREARRLGIYVE